MTANAMQGDREKCLEAGMDDYVSKPIRIHELVAAIGRVMKEVKLNLAPNSESINIASYAPHFAASNLVKTSLISETGHIDGNLLLENFDGDRTILKIAIESYLEDYPKRLVEIRKAIVYKNAEDLSVLPLHI